LRALQPLFAVELLVANDGWVPGPVKAVSRRRRGRRPAFTGPATTQPYSATEVDGWQRLSRVFQNRAAVQWEENMNVPGFTAEASLYKTSQLYFAFRSVRQAASAVRPQSSCLDDCLDLCGTVDDCFDSHLSLATCFLNVGICRARCRSHCGSKKFP
jgi:hypothetical protein